MRKALILLSLASGLLVGCGEYVPPQEINQKQSNYHNLDNAKIVIIDSCEYIQFQTYGYRAITNKGNCKNHKTP